MSSIKIIDASQAHNITRYKNLKRKILKCCANIYFNKQCLQHNLTSQYTKITIPITLPVAIHTQPKGPYVINNKHYIYQKYCCALTEIKIYICICIYINIHL